MEEKNIGTDKMADRKSLEMDVYGLIRSAEIRDYYRRENVCDNWEKKVLLIQHSFISVQKKAAMMRTLSGTGTVEENRVAEEMCLIYSRYIDMIHRPLVRTLFVLESTGLCLEEESAGRYYANLRFNGVYDSLDEVIAYMEYLYGDEPEKAIACVTVLHVPPDAKVKDVLEFQLVWIDGKWEIIKFFGDDKELGAHGISAGAINLFSYHGGFQYHPLPFENGCRLRLRFPFMEEPVYGTLESELDGNGCWYHFLYLDEEDGVYKGIVNLTNAETELTSGFSSLDWIERAQEETYHV